MERIFDDKIQTEEIELTCNKMKTKEEIFDNSFWYDDFNECEQALLKGISCIKHNYTDSKVKMVRLTLSKDKKALCYREINPKNSFKAAVKGKRSISFESMKGFLYGALTQTFINRRQGCLQAMSKEKMKVMK